MNRIEMKPADLQELYGLLHMYGQTYGSNLAGQLMDEIANRCQGRGINPDEPNPRHAGRKPVYGAETAEQVQALRKQGWTVREISAATGCSIGHVHNLITEHMEKQGKTRR